MTPDSARLYAVIDSTWPAAALIEAGPWVLREGRGGGKRVSAATQARAWRVGDLGAAEQAMRLMGQTPLFMIREGEENLDAALAERGYEVIDPVNMWVCPIEALTDQKIPLVRAFTIWEPLASMREIWQEAEIGPERWRVMDRAQGAKTGLFGRAQDTPAGVGFCALDDDIAMVHALHLRAKYRGKGLGSWMMRAASFWAQKHGARWMSVVCTQDNAGANGLYAALGMEHIGRYHYRIQPYTIEEAT